MSATAIDPAQMERLASSIAGNVLLPGGAGYDEGRRVHNGLVDRHPAAIVRCRAAADVSRTLAFAREAGLEVTVRGGGHNVAGRAVADGAVMIDLAEMRGVEVDPAAGTVTAQGGATWAELNDAAAAHGLAVTGGVISSTGVAGLTLGGGLGWLMGSQGLSVDNLLAVELVLATGDVRRVTEASDPDLFWALRGGGGNFGVATSFTFGLHEVGIVVGGLVAHPFEAAREVLEFYRDFTKDLRDEFSVFAGLVHAPDGSGMKLAAFVVCHSGSEDQANADLEPLLAFGSPAMVEVGPMPYPVMNTLLDDSYPRGVLSYWKSSFLRQLDDATIDTMIDRFAVCPSPMTAMVIEHFHGAVTRVPLAATAVPHRDPGYNVVITSEWMDPAVTDENIAWTRDTYAALQPHALDRRYVNYLDDDDGSAAVRSAYGPHFDRLREVKRRYDPHNTFRHNHNIEPLTPDQRG
jgi:FAD/FMN-containing dehydrogenase